ncbi:MAG TPA: hypothetical protein PKA64_03935 [Myxococcota bacterium]|nr:hypothetical protein [Myxococcota bacterium]
MYRLAEDAIDWFVQAAIDAGLAAAAAEQAARSALLCSGIGAERALEPWHRPILAMAGRRQILGITLGDVVYVASPDALTSWPLVSHEVVHVVQYQQAGTPRFLAGYALEYVRNRLRGLADHDAYLALSSEVIARRVERLAARRGPPPRRWLIPVDRGRSHVIDAPTHPGRTRA